MAGSPGLALLGAHRAKRLQHLGDRALLAERRDPQRLDRLLVAGSGDVGHQRAFQHADVVGIFVHGEIHVVISVLPWSRCSVIRLRQQKNPR